MDRRDILKSAVSVAAATSLVGATKSSASESLKRAPDARNQSGPYTAPIDLTGTPTAKMIPARS